MSVSPAFDPLIHAPLRLQACAILSSANEVEFALMRDTLGVSDSVLSKHLSALGEAGYVRLTKSALDGRQRTWASFTRAGRRAFAAHMRALQALVASAEQAIAAE
jgi:DNA-binding MarR family transcriptional regulator